jgi:hypothetical protein
VEAARVEVARVEVARVEVARPRADRSQGTSVLVRGYVERTSDACMVFEVRITQIGCALLS